MNIDQTIAEEIIGRIANGEPLRATLRSDERFPSHTWFYKWLEADAELKAMFRAARDAGFDVIAEDCLRIADTPLEGVTEKYERVMIDNPDEPGGEAVEEFKLTERKVEDMLGHRKLQIETRLKLLAKWDPRRYGDKIDLNHGGSLATSLTVRFRRSKKSGDDAGG